MTKKSAAALHGPRVSESSIEQKIYVFRNQKVMLDSDLAKMYGVSAKRLNEQVKRNRERFPEDFMFQLSLEEAEASRFQNGTLNLRSHFATSSSRSQNGTLNKGYGGRRYLPYVFTEQGVAMLSAVLKSKRAVDTSIAIIRVFVRLRQILMAHQEFAKKLDELERKYEKHDTEIETIFRALRKLIDERKEPPPSHRRIGFSI